MLTENQKITVVMALDFISHNKTLIDQFQAYFDQAFRADEDKTLSNIEDFTDIKAELFPYDDVTLSNPVVPLHMPLDEIGHIVRSIDFLLADENLLNYEEVTSEGDRRILNDKKTLIKIQNRLSKDAIDYTRRIRKHG